MSKLETWDYVAVALYFVAVIATGIYVSTYMQYIYPVARVAQPVSAYVLYSTVQ